MNARLPPLGTLLAFEAAAQFDSFASAAKHLHVTPAAISQQMHTLESHLDLLLFTRSKAGVKLTRAGESYLVFVKSALDKLRIGQKHLTQFSDLDVLTITALPSVAQKWLMPLVMQWMDLNPEIEVRIEASHEKVNFSHSASDMCVSFGDSGYIGVHKEKLLVDSVSMVASPELLDRFDNRSNIEQLLKQPMIHVDWGDDNESLPQWQDWINRVSGDESEVQSGPRFNLSSMAIDAAVQGKGLLLGQHLLIKQELKKKQLEVPLNVSLALGRAYYLIYPQRTLDNDKANLFMQWLKEKLIEE
jgi:LysR family glycine cleavage system transcriptional activator